MGKFTESEYLIETCCKIWLVKSFDGKYDKALAKTITKDFILEGEDNKETFAPLTQRIFDNVDEERAMFIVEFISKYMKELAVSLDKVKDENASLAFTFDEVDDLEKYDKSIYTHLLRYKDAEKTFLESCGENDLLKHTLDILKFYVGMLAAAVADGLNLEPDVKHNAFYNMLKERHSKGYADEVFKLASESLNQAAKEMDAVKAQHIKPGKILKEYLDSEGIKVCINKR